MSLNIKYFMCLFPYVISGNFALKLQNSNQEHKSICFLYLKKESFHLKCLLVYGRKRQVPLFVSLICR